MASEMTSEIKTILIVDDSKLARVKITKILIENGYTVYQADNAQHGLELLDTHNPDLILLDLLMPDMDGFEFLAILHDNKYIVPVIVLTADIQESSRKRCLELGACDFLNKPPDSGLLLSTVKKIIG